MDNPISLFILTYIPQIQPAEIVAATTLPAPGRAPAAAEAIAAPLEHAFTVDAILCGRAASASLSIDSTSSVAIFNK